MEKQKTGHWVEIGSLSCRCSQCGCKSPKEFNFCPTCGIPMNEDALKLLQKRQ